MNRSWLGRVVLLAVGLGMAAAIVLKEERRYQIHETEIVTRPIFDPPGIKYAQTVGPERDRVRGWVVGSTPPAKRPGVRRILAVGDSLTWGLGVTLTESWPTALDEMLPEWEVFNLGMCGYDAEQVVSLVTAKLDAWQPDLVIWGHYTNDVEPTFLMFGAHDAHPVFVGTSIPAPARILPQGLSLWLVQHSAMFRQLQAAKLARVLANGFTPTGPARWYERQLDHLRDWAATTSTPVVVLALPDHTQAAPDLCTKVISEKDCRDQAAAYQKITTALQTSGLNWVDGQALYAASGRPHFMGADRDSGHPTPAGHRALARGLVATVEAMKR